MTNTAYLDDVECGALGTLQLKVEFDYTPEDDGGDQYQSWPESYEVTAIHMVVEPGKYWPSVAIDAVIPEVLLDITALKTIDEKALIDLIREVEE